LLAVEPNDLTDILGAEQAVAVHQAAVTEQERREAEAKPPASGGDEPAA
jgi:hypothetical protein